MVSGQLPFQGDYDKAVMYSITTEEPAPLTGLRTGVPMELEWLVGKCLAKEAAQRYQNTEDLIVDLERGGVGLEHRPRHQDSRELRRGVGLLAGLVA